jgi:hypothetical protein
MARMRYLGMVLNVLIFIGQTPLKVKNIICVALFGIVTKGYERIMRKSYIWAIFFIQRALAGIAISVNDEIADNPGSRLDSIGKLRIEYSDAIRADTMRKLNV